METEREIIEIKTDRREKYRVGQKRSKRSEKPAEKRDLRTEREGSTEKT